ncbi:acyltransferase family protein [Actinomycetospora chiangmaiensis]|uniref:acyltransferase family protein n=1 Tax=Actinomycetospora chiangmaiensis TaxID=402650 RepID=UPI000381E2A0|nr:acyltransferase [Actinomycetospora chiangmaiensis]
MTDIVQRPASPATHVPGTATERPRTAGGSSRRVSWDVLRCVFVLLVMLYHSTFIGPLVYHDILPKNYTFPHQVGASLLLVLSAYFVAATVRRGGARRGATARWWWGKLARLLPAFFVATVNAWLFLRYLAPDGWYLPGKRDLLANLVMLWHWDPSWGFVDGSYWTIPLQLMAFCLAAVMWRSPLGRGLGLRAVLWLAVLMPAAQWYYRATLPAGNAYGYVVDGLGIFRWHLFVAGVAVWMYATGRLRLPHFLALVVAAVAEHALQSSILDPTTGWATDWTAVALIAVGIAAMTLAAVGPDWGARLPRPVVRAVTWLAGISYGVFLTHQTVGYVVMRRAQDLGVGPTLQTGLMIVTGVICGWLLTTLVERPVHHRLMAWWDTGPARYGRIGVSDSRS